MIGAVTRKAMLPTPISFVADLACPERCAACDVEICPTTLFCSTCSAIVHLLGAPECIGCGAARATNEPCPSCTAPSPIRRARAWAAYEGGATPVATAIARFKYHGARRLGRRLAVAMSARIPSNDVTLVAPVPLHARRLRERGFNQSAILARHLARSIGCPVTLGAIARHRDTPSQLTRSSADLRATNVRDAFLVTKPAHVRDHVVLLVDDVWTSGATARAVAETLVAAEARAVDVLTIARVR